MRRRLLAAELNSLGRQPALLGTAPVAPKHPRKTVTMLLRVAYPPSLRPSASNMCVAVADTFASTGWHPNCSARIVRLRRVAA